LALVERVSDESSEAIPRRIPNYMTEQCPNQNQKIENVVDVSALAEVLPG